MKALDITTGDLHQYAKIMAETLAVMHWVGEMDGNDIEFVLAPPGEAKGGSSALHTESNVLGDHAMWVLDFDLCRKMAMDLEGVRQAVSAFWGNDPYYPRPDKDLSLWEVFREHYIQASEECTAIREPRAAKTRRALSRQFIDLVEEEGKHRAKRDSS